MITNHFIEKFTKCPECGGYTLSRQNNLNEDKRGGVFAKNNHVYCSNCKNEFILKGNTLRKKGEISEEIIETKESVYNIPAKTAKSHKFIYVFLIFLVITAVFIYLILSKSSNNENPLPDLVKKTKVNEKINRMKDPKISTDKYLSKTRADKIKKETKKDQPTFVKVFENSYIKVRSSHPDESAPSFSWFYLRNNISITRSSEQKVFICGGPFGKRHWAVDDEIRINNKKIRGCIENMVQTGVIPNDKKLPPYEITRLVPPDREVKLNISLVDYGVFWGNTPIYIVIK